MLCRVVLSLLLASLTTCAERDGVSKVCPAACYDGPFETLDIGACHAGIPLCDNDFNIIKCMGEVTPTSDNCNGVVDEMCKGATTDGADDPRVGRECGSNVGSCSFGHNECVQGQIKCVGSVDPKPETCLPLGYDSDCDGIPNNIPPTLCYDGDTHDLLSTTSVCKAGVLTCVNGNPRCTGEILPTFEECGDMIDKNCDGVIGDGPGQAAPVDIILVMDHAIPDGWKYRIEAALTIFLHAHSASQYHYTLIDMPGEMQPAYEGQCQLTINAGSADDVLNWLPKFDWEYGVLEYPYDVIYDLVHTYDIHWQPGAKRILFTFMDDNDCGDDNQSECNLANRIHGSSEAIIALTSAEITYVAFSLPQYNDYLPLSTATKGATFDISLTTVSDIVTDMDMFVSAPCQ